MKRLLIAGGAAVTFVIVGALFGVADIDELGALVMAAVAVCLIPVVVGVARGSHDPFEPSYLFALSFGVLFVTRPLLEWSPVSGVPTMSGLDPTPTYLAALGLAILGGLSFYAGYYSPLGIGLTKRLPQAPGVLNPARVRIGVLFVAVVGVALYAAFLVTSGGLSTLAFVIAGRNQEFVATISQPAGYLYSGLQFIFPAGVLLLVMATRWASPTGAVGMALIAVAVIPAFFTGARSGTLPALLTVIVLWYLRRGSRPGLSTMAAFGAAAFILVISVPRDYRNTDDRTGSLTDALAASIANAEATGHEFFLGLDTAMLPTLAVEIANVPETIPFQFGSTYMEAALRPIPRAFWSAKPEAAETQLMQALWPDLAAQRIGLAFSLFGEPYLNFGIPGVLVVTALFGAAWRTAWQVLRRQPRNSVALGIYAISWPFLFVYLRGGIGVDYQRQLIALVPFIALAWFAARGISRLEPTDPPRVSSMGDAVAMGGTLASQARRPAPSAGRGSR